VLHKILEAELKALYVAITRAKCRLWIADMSEEKRAAMYEYWYKRGLAIIVDTAAKAADKVFVKQARSLALSYQIRARSHTVFCDDDGILYCFYNAVDVRLCASYIVEHAALAQVCMC
jgi:hypothetical protein